MSGGDAAGVVGLRGRLFVWFQYVLPQHGLSRLVLAATRVREKPALLYTRTIYRLNADVKYFPICASYCSMPAKLCYN